MKRGLLLAPALVPGLALAQSLPTGAIQAAAAALRPIPPQNPLDATGFPNPPAEEGELPPPELEDRRFRIIKAGRTKQNGNQIEMSGGVEFLARGYRIVGEKATGDLGTQVFVIEGDARLVGKDAIVAGDKIQAALDAGTYRAEGATATIRPALLQNAVTDNVYVSGQESEGTQREQRSRYADLTTCPLPEPHYTISADRSVVRPGKRAILRGVGIHILGRTILKIPFLVVPLDDRTYRNTPTVGQSQDEGYFIKQRTGIPLPERNPNDFLSVRTDYMTKLGLGLGGDWGYDRRNVRGTLGAYIVTGPGMVSLRNQHEQRLSRNLLFAVENQYDRENYLSAPGSRVFNTRALMTWRQNDGATTRLGLNRNQNATPNSTATSQVLTLGDERRILGGVRTQTSLDYNIVSAEYSGGGQTGGDERRTVDARFNASRTYGWADTSLEYQRNIPVGDTQGVFGAADRTPVFTLKTDARRLIGESFERRLPLRMAASIGEFGVPTGDQVTRQMYEARFDRPGNSRRRFSFGTNGRFRQTIYSDDTAQYLVAGGFDARYAFGDDTSANLRYQYIRPEGYTPLSLDQTGQTHQINGDISYRPLKGLLVGGQTGYDFIQSKRGEVAWQQIGTRLEYRARNAFLFRALGTYDTFQGAWSSVRLDATYRPPGFDRPFVSASARFDGFTHTWTNLNLYLDNVRLTSKARLSANLAYNGITKRLEAQQYSLIYDLHCAEAIVLFSSYATGFRAGSDVQFLIRIKAVPFGTNFGLGTRGQPLGTSTGRD